MLRRYRDPLVALLALVLPVVFFLSNSKSERQQNVFDRSVVWVSSPIQWLVVNTLESVSDAWSRYVALVGVEEENQALREELGELRTQVAQLQEEAKENERLKLLLELRDRSEATRSVTARIVATSPSPLFRSVRIDRGAEDGLRVGAAVVNHDGVVGRVAAVTDGWADVVLLVDANNSVEVLVARTRAPARVRGLGGDKGIALKVEQLGRTEDVEPGDLLITSGVGTAFPKGLPVGRVLAVERGSFGLFQQAEVEPTVDFRRLEEVMVLLGGWDDTSTYEEDLGIADDPAKAGGAGGSG